MTWKCFGFLEQCRVGTRYFRSEDDGLCIEDPDLERYDGNIPLEIVFCVINKRSLSHPHRHVSAWRDGAFMGTVLMFDHWDHMELTYDIPGDGVWEFKLQDSDTSEILCSTMIGVNKDATYEEEVPDEDIGEDVIDYRKIKDDMIDIENDLMGKIKYIDLINDYDAINDKKEVMDKIGAQARDTQDLVNNSANTMYSTYSALDKVVTGLGINILNDVQGLVYKFRDYIPLTPNAIKDTIVDTCADLATALWDAILNKIEERYPDDDEESD